MITFTVCDEIWGFGIHVQAIVIHLYIPLKVHLIGGSQLLTLYLL